VNLAKQTTTVTALDWLPKRYTGRIHEPRIKSAPTEVSSQLQIENDKVVGCVVCQYWLEQLDHARKRLSFNRVGKSKISHFSAMLKDHQSRGACARRLSLLSDLRIDPLWPSLPFVDSHLMNQRSSNDLGALGLDVPWTISLCTDPSGAAAAAEASVRNDAPSLGQASERGRTRVRNRNGRT